MKPKIAVEGRKASGTCHVTIENLATVPDFVMPSGDSADTSNWAPDASAAAEKFGGTRDEIPADQHAWTEEQFRSRVTKTLEGYGDLNETKRMQMTELLMRHR